MGTALTRLCPPYGHEPGDGWEPICRFLGVPISDAPYPSVNSTEDFQAMVKKEKA